MTERFEKIAVLGLGLLGGSIALAAKARGVAAVVAGTGRRPEALAEARRRGSIEATTSLAEAVRGAGLVILCTPVSSMADQIRAAAPHLQRDAIVTDVGSVKAPLVDTLPGLLPSGVAYVGAHPMAGSHHRGIEHARADLLDGAACVLTPTRETPPHALSRVSAFFTALGARVVLRDPSVHDAEVGWMSHVPHALAFAFARALRAAPEAAGEVAGPGFRDFTRIAQSDAELWSDILLANRKAVGAALQSVRDEIGALAAALDDGDPDALERFIAAARQRLARISERAGGDRER
ncbi:MAG: prephenate dehydrogenase/arogenate dehydrogenase family protein [Deltaproteobacteria bacterium]|nr:MAG: prephenate dehydrogenase/arogenate dehydrogenase family protein [Deltaproteobacteria bacterium]